MSGDRYLRHLQFANALSLALGEDLMSAQAICLSNKLDFAEQDWNVPSHIPLDIRIAFKSASLTMDEMNRLLNWIRTSQESNLEKCREI